MYASIRETCSHSASMTPPLANFPPQRGSNTNITSTRLVPNFFCVVVLRIPISQPFTKPMRYISGHAQNTTFYEDKTPSCINYQIIIRNVQAFSKQDTLPFQVSSCRECLANYTLYRHQLYPFFHNQPTNVTHILGNGLEKGFNHCNLLQQLHSMFLFLPSITIVALLTSICAIGTMFNNSLS